ncbi:MULTISPECIES: PilZ domain-containing protein [Bacillaceae]|uniref:PilZ domain-containing protein n=1 Tax=Bacillaceae TaxID=186817 RepID=UPI00300027B7
MKTKISRRVYDRVKFNIPMKASIELVSTSFDQKMISENEEVVYVIDLSAGGMRCASQVEFPVNYLNMYKILLTLNGRELVFYGKVIRKRSLDNQFFEYGVQFNFNHINQNQGIT